MHDLLGLLALLGIGFVVFVVAMILHTARSLSRPPRRTYASAVSRNIPGDPSELATPRAFESRAVCVGRLELPIWDIPGDTPGGPSVVLTPGWADSRVGALARLDAFVPAAKRVIAWEPPGLGECAGRCHLGTREVGLLAALLDAECAGERVVLAGWSMGAGISIALASEAPTSVAGVVAEAPYRLPQTPARGVMRARGMPMLFNLAPAFWLIGARNGVGPAWRGFDRAVLAERVRAPLLVLHGTGDPVCPVSDGREIAAAASDGTVVETRDGGHNDLWTAPEFREIQLEAVQRFMSDAAARSPTIVW